MSGFRRLGCNGRPDLSSDGSRYRWITKRFLNPCLMRLRYSSVNSVSSRSCVWIGNSMRPCIRHGDRLHVELRPARFRLGDVLIRRHQGKFIAHRLVAVRGKELVLRGYANLVYDPPVLKNQVVGRVTGVENTTGFADYSSLRWQAINLLMARFSGRCRILQRVKGSAIRLIQKIR